MASRRVPEARASAAFDREGGTRDAVEVRLTPGNAIRGRVIDGATGAPVLDATVALQRAGGSRALAILMGESDAHTDGEGRFTIEGVAAGWYGVIAQHPDYASATTSVEVKDGPAPLELRLVAGGTLGGTVLSETARPCPGPGEPFDGAGAPGTGRRSGRFAAAYDR